MFVVSFRIGTTDRISYTICETAAGGECSNSERKWKIQYQ